MRKLSGYMTVEASFIVPMTICVFILIIYFTNYMYARCMLAQDSYILAFRASTAENEDMQQTVMDKSQMVAGNKYFGNTRPVFDGETRGKEITVTGKTTTRHGAMGRFFLKPKKGWEIETKSTARKRKYSDHIRTVKRIKDIATKEDLWNTDTIEN
nr:hypothetical protein [uncultured Butyrivibrio sp.]